MSRMLIRIDDSNEKRIMAGDFSRHDQFRLVPATNHPVRDVSLWLPRAEKGVFTVINDLDWHVEAMSRGQMHPAVVIPPHRALILFHDGRSVRVSAEQAAGGGEPPEARLTNVEIEARVARQGTQITNNTNAIAQNGRDITTLDGRVETLEEDTGPSYDDTAVRGLITTNATNIRTNIGNITENSAQIQQNANNIQINTGNITTNTSDISSLGGRVTRIEADGGGGAAYDDTAVRALIATNTGNIAANSAALASEADVFPFNVKLRPATMLQNGTDADLALGNGTTSDSYDMRTLAVGADFDLFVRSGDSNIINMPANIVADEPFFTLWEGSIDISSNGLVGNSYCDAQLEVTHFAGMDNAFTSTRVQRFRILNKGDIGFPLSGFNSVVTLPQAQIDRFTLGETIPMRFRIRITLFQDQNRTVRQNWSAFTNATLRPHEFGVQFLQTGRVRGTVVNPGGTPDGGGMDGGGLQPGRLTDELEVDFGAETQTITITTEQFNSTFFYNLSAAETRSPADVLTLVLPSDVDGPIVIHNDTRHNLRMMPTGVIASGDQVMYYYTGTRLIPLSTSGADSAYALASANMNRINSAVNTLNLHTSEISNIRLTADDAQTVNQMQTNQINHLTDAVNHFSGGFPNNGSQQLSEFFTESHTRPLDYLYTDSQLGITVDSNPTTLTDDRSTISLPNDQALFIYLNGTTATPTSTVTFLPELQKRSDGNYWITLPTAPTTVRRNLFTATGSRPVETYIVGDFNGAHAVSFDYVNGLPPRLGRFQLNITLILNGVRYPHTLTVVGNVARTESPFRIHGSDLWATVIINRTTDGSTPVVRFSWVPADAHSTSFANAMIEVEAFWDDAVPAGTRDVLFTSIRDPLVVIINNPTVRLYSNRKVMSFQTAGAAMTWTNRGAGWRQNITGMNFNVAADLGILALRAMNDPTDRFLGARTRVSGDDVTTLTTAASIDSRSNELLIAPRNAPSNTYTIGTDFDLSRVWLMRTEQGLLMGSLNSLPSGIEYNESTGVLTSTVGGITGLVCLH